MLIRLLLTLASVLLFALCFPDGPLPLAAFVCLVPFAVALNGATARVGLLLGFLCGFLFWLIAAWWLANGFYYYVRLPWPAAWFWTVIGCLVASFPYAFFGFLSGRFGWMKTPVGRFKAAAAFTVLLSWYPFLFPGSYVHSLYAVPLVIQIVDLGGVPLLLLAVNLINFFIAGAVLDRTIRCGPLKNVLVALAVLALLMAYGASRLRGFHEEMAAADKSRLAKVVSIQPNLSLRRAGVPQVFGDAAEVNNEDTALTLSIEAAKQYPDAQAIVWPELPSGISCSAENEIWRAVSDRAEQTGIPFIVNCYEYDRAAGGDYNKAQMINGNGEFGSAYQKRILLPFGEYLPGERQIPWLRRIFPRVLNYIPGNDTATLLPVGDKWRVIPTLCYEVLFPGLVREFVREGGDVIVNLVDDVWFGESDASAIHMALAVFRATEFRVPLVRVTNSGNGVFVQPTGEIVKGSRTPVFQPRVTSFPLYVPHERSFYATLGNMFLIFLTVVWLGEMAFSGFRKLRVVM